MLLKDSTRQIFVDLGYAPKAAERLKVPILPSASAPALTPTKHRLIDFAAE
jgi:hypothetical protein